MDKDETLDTDGDNLGNNADLDDDGDGISDAEDNFPLDSAFGVFGPEDVDQFPLDSAYQGGEFWEPGKMGDNVTACWSDKHAEARDDGNGWVAGTNSTGGGSSCTRWGGCGTVESEAEKFNQLNVHNRPGTHSSVWCKDRGCSYDGEDSGFGGVGVRCCAGEGAYHEGSCVTIALRLDSKQGIRMYTPHPHSTQSSHQRFWFDVGIAFQMFKILMSSNTGYFHHIKATLKQS